MLPQVTDLALSFGVIFEQSDGEDRLRATPASRMPVITGVDYNLIMGITLLSIIGIATASLFVDLLYPLLDLRALPVGQAKRRFLDGCHPRSVSPVPRSASAQSS
ncbi:MAG: hypothetical protein R3A10_14805 [Caldilineaceae bacterium]